MTKNISRHGSRHRAPYTLRSNMVGAQAPSGVDLPVSTPPQPEGAVSRLHGREPIAKCSCGQTVWFELPHKTQSLEVGGLRWYSLECPHCKSGCMAVGNEYGVMTESQAALMIYGKGGIR